MSHKYLDDLLVGHEKDCIFNTDKIDSDRHELFNKQREEWGFDERETWALEFTLATWLYSHLMMYKEVACIDMGFHKFEMLVDEEIPEDELNYIGPDGTKWNYPINYYRQISKKVTQGEAIDIMLEYLKEYITCKKIDLEEEQKTFEHYQTALKIFATVAGSMWW